MGSIYQHPAIKCDVHTSRSGINIFVIYRYSDNDDTNTAHFSTYFIRILIHLNSFHRTEKGHIKSIPHKCKKIN